MGDQSVSLDTPVGTLLSSSAETAQILQILGINTCCDLDRSLRDASLAAGVRPEETLSILRGDAAPAAPPRPDWNGSSLSEMTRHVVDHYHLSARRHLTTLIPLAARVCSSHASRNRAIWKVYDNLQKLARDLIPHMSVEEKHLFPYIETMDSSGGRDTTHVVPLFGTVEYPLQSLRHEHAEDLSAVRQIREVTQAFTIGEQTCEPMRELVRGLQEFVFELEQHIALEDDVLFPRALEREKQVRRRM